MSVANPYQRPHFGSAQGRLNVARLMERIPPERREQVLRQITTLLRARDAAALMKARQRDLFDGVNDTSPDGPQKSLFNDLKYPMPEPLGAHQMDPSDSRFVGSYTPPPVYGVGLPALTTSHGVRTISLSPSLVTLDGNWSR